MENKVYKSENLDLVDFFRSFNGIKVHFRDKEVI
jgi:hypothetical protein